MDKYADSNELHVIKSFQGLKLGNQFFVNSLNGPFDEHKLTTSAVIVN